MENLVNEIYNSYLIENNKLYDIVDLETKIIKNKSEIFEGINFEKQKLFEEIEHLNSIITHKNNLELLTFALKYLKNKKPEL